MASIATILMTSATACLMLVCLAIALLFLSAVPIGVFYLVSLPLRRQERARFFLDLVEQGLNHGQSLEHTVVGVSQTREPSVGARFHLLAAHLESGLRLEQALEKVPGLLPPQILAILRTGTRLGDLRRVLPACRRLLADGLSQTRGALNYLLLLLAFLLPVMPAFYLFLRIYVFPFFIELSLEIGAVQPTYTQAAMQWSLAFAVVQMVLSAVLLILVLGYTGGPRLKQWGRRFCRRPIDRMLAALPWRHKRLQRDFAGMLALLLDAEVPENAAVRLAAECTDNWVFSEAATTAVRQLEQGTPLIEAVAAMDSSRELQWRIRNGAGGRGGFVAALTGWLESLEARAFQQEQAATQLFTTGVVLLNGVMVGFLVLGIFRVLILMIQKAVLW